MQGQAPATNNVQVVTGPAPIDTSAGTVTVRDSQNADGALKVALLVPLSGANAPIGEAMKNAAQMAVFEGGTTGFQLLPRDSGNAPETAASAASQAVADGADLIIGPLLSAQARPVAQAVAQSGVPVVTLSNDRALGADGLLVMGLIPADQVRRVLSYAAAHGKRSVAIIAPAGPYGDTIVQAAQEILPQTGQSLVTIARGGTPPVIAQFKADGGLNADSILIAHDAKQMPAVLTALMMPFTYSIANGLAFGFVSYALIKLLTGRAREVHAATWGVAALFVIRFAFFVE